MTVVGGYFMTLVVSQLVQALRTADCDPGEVSRDCGERNQVMIPIVGPWLTVDHYGPVLSAVFGVPQGIGVVVALTAQSNMHPVGRAVSAHPIKSRS